MSDILTIKKYLFGTVHTNSVDARTLHKRLLLRSDFSTWIKKEVKFLATGVDYIRIHNKMEANNATRIDYIITLDVAKSISMMQRNKKGKEIRDYFIACEKQIQKPKSLTRKELAQLIIDAEVEKEILEEKLLKKDIHIKSIAKVMIDSGEVSIGDFAKNIAIKGIGPNKLFELLRMHSVLFKDKSNKPYQTYVDAGYFKLKPLPVFKGHAKYQTVITPRGQVWLVIKLKKYGYMEE